MLKKLLVVAGNLVYPVTPKCEYWRITACLADKFEADGFAVGEWWTAFGEGFIEQIVEFACAEGFGFGGVDGDYCIKKIMQAFVIFCRCWKCERLHDIVHAVFELDFDVGQAGGFVGDGVPFVQTQD